MIIPYDPELLHRIFFLSTPPESSRLFHLVPMESMPSEVVFSTGPLSSESVVFQYTNGPLKVSLPKRRGRPAGCESTDPSKVDYQHGLTKNSDKEEATPRGVRSSAARRFPLQVHQFWAHVDPNR